MKWQGVVSSVWGIVALGFLWGGGIVCFKHPEQILARLSRPITEKHLMAMRLIAAMFFTLAIITSFRLILYLWKSN